jgi:hypothetical protein
VKWPRAAVVFTHVGADDEQVPAAPAYTPTNIRRLGDRIRIAVERGEQPAPEDLELLDEYRAWHYHALRHAQDRLGRLFHKKLKIEPELVDVAARPLKTIEAIIAKLVREKTRLSKMHDIAGARIRVADLAIQDAVVKAVQTLFDRSNPRIVKDSREAADT